MSEYKKATDNTLPKSIRKPVKTIMEAVKTKDGVALAGVIYARTDGKLGIFATGPEQLRTLLTRVVDDLLEFDHAYQAGFQRGQDSVFHPNPAR